MSKHNDFGNIEYINKYDEVKFAIANRVDYEWARDKIRWYKLNYEAGEVLLSPVHNEITPKQLAEWMLSDNLDARLQIQLHKYIWGPNKRGV